MNAAKPERRLAHALGLSLMVFLNSGMSFAHDMVPGAQQDRAIALRRGTIHTVSGEAIARGTLLFAEGKIVALGTKVAIPRGCQVIDIKGKHVYPGLISSNSTGTSLLPACRSIWMSNTSSNIPMILPFMPSFSRTSWRWP